MKPMKIVCPFLTVLSLITGSAFAQTSGTTTKPTATTSTNRQQELYDQYHGITKKQATTVPTTTPTATPAQPQRQTSSYSSTQPTTTVSRPQQTSYDGSTSGLRIGLRSGVTYLIFTEKQPLNDPSFGFVGGVTLNFGSGTVSFQPEVNYGRYSVKATNPFDGLKVTAAFDQIEVPLFLKISSGSNAGNRFFVNVGPYGAYLASISLNGKKESLTGAKGRFGYGAAAGIGTALKAGPGHITIEVRGMYSFGDTETGFTTDSKTILTQGTVGYSFPLGGR